MKWLLGIVGAVLGVSFAFVAGIGMCILQGYGGPRGSLAGGYFIVSWMVFVGPPSMLIGAALGFAATRRLRRTPESNHEEPRGDE